jgi:hypothetical protein
VLWGNSTDNDGFYNDADVCEEGPGFAMGDAVLLASGQDDAFDDAGVVLVDGSYYVVPGGLNGPVDLTGATLQSPTATTGPFAVNVQWQGAGPGTIRELVSLTNPGAADVSQEVVLETNLGSDANDNGNTTLLQASSTGDISGYPTTARWFATSDANTPPSDPPIVSVATGPGTVRSPATIQDCPEAGSLKAQQKNDAKASAAEAPSSPDEAGATADPTGSPDGVSASATVLGTDNFTYHYTVNVPAGQTRYLMVFWSLYSTVAEAVGAGPAWNTNPASGSEALTGLTPAQLQLIVNRAFPLELAPRFTG